MSNTHKNEEGLSRARRQAAYVTSGEYTRGVLGNYVAQRCGLLSNPETIALLWWLQRVSWRDGGLEGFARDFLRDHSHLIGTRSMHRFGRRAGQIYTAEQVKAIRGELHLPHQNARDIFPLKDETTLRAFRALSVTTWQMDSAEIEARRERAQAEAAQAPTSYPASDFLEHCDIESDEKFAQALQALILNPKIDPEAGLWNMPSLFKALSESRDREIAQAASGIVTTEVTRSVSDMLDFALQQRAFVLIEGREGIGKTEAAENWCARHPGRAIYAKLESGGDDGTFFRSLARQVGTATSYPPKEVRMRLEDALQLGHLMVVLDESHFLWPDRQSKLAPRRVDWLRTALIDHNVPVAVVSTPQFFENQCTRFRGIGWNANQIQRRLTETLTLPEQLEVKDVLAVARAVFPSADEPTLKRVGAFALGSVGYLTSIKHVRQLAEFEQSKQSGLTTQAAVLRVLERKGLPVPPGADSKPSGGRVKTVLSEPAGRVKSSSAVPNFQPQPRTRSAQVVPL